MEPLFKKLNITPNSKSYIEKRVSKLKDYFKANNNIHLIAITKDLGII
jgi:two-component system capsular synthesis response regulator RcsB